MLWINKIYSVEPASHPILLFLKSPIFKIGLAFSLKYDKYLSDTVKDIITKQTRIHWLDRWIVRKELDIIPTYHYLQNQGKLMMQSQENGQKPQFEQILTISRPNISKLQIFLKNRIHSNWRSYLALTSGRKPKNRCSRFWEKYQSVWFWTNLETFSRISPNQEFFSKIRLCHFSTFIVP